MREYEFSARLDHLARVYAGFTGGARIRGHIQPFVHCRDGRLAHRRCRVIVKIHEGFVCHRVARVYHRVNSF